MHDIVTKRKDENENNSVQSFSGHEKNKLFMNQQAETFLDFSAVAGVDSSADGRAIGLLDYDQDGWQDFVLVNANSPQVEIFRNQIGLKDTNNQQHRIAFRLVGGKTDSKVGGEWSNRDGYGAVISVKAGGKTYLREIRCGEGFAAQNSKTVLIGLGNNKVVDSVEIAWPSGKKQTLKTLRPGTINVIHEKGEINTTAFQESKTRDAARSKPTGKFQFANLPKDKPSVYITTATWCASCKKNLAQVEALKNHFSDQLYLYGLPVDPKDNQQKLEIYEETQKTAYKILSDINIPTRKQVSNLIYSRLGQEVLPSTIITDKDGQILLIQKGVPSISDIKRLNLLSE